MQADHPSSESRRSATAATADRRDDDLDADTIDRRLSSRDERWRVRVVDVTGSTNADLLADVRRSAGRDLPTLLVAAHQSAGRGRLGRTWQSEARRSLTVSFALRMARRVGLLEGVTLVCGLAVVEVVSALGVPARLKWPNDVLVGQRKLAGILVEAHALGDATALVVGVGLNVAALAEPAGGIGATSLAEAGAAPCARNAIVADLAAALAERLAVFERGGFAPFVDAWRAVDAYAGRPVFVKVGDDAPVAGRHAGIDPTGALLVDVDGARRRFIGGDVSVRLAP